MAEHDIALVRAFFEATNTRDLKRVLALAHPEGEIDWGESEGPLRAVYRGHEGFRKFWDSWFGVFEDVRIEAEEILAVGDDIVVCVLTRVTGRDGICLTARGVHVYTIREEQIFRLRLRADVEEALEEARGADPPQPDI